MATRWNFGWHFSFVPHRHAVDTERDSLLPCYFRIVRNSFVQLNKTTSTHWNSVVQPVRIKSSNVSKSWISFLIFFFVRQSSSEKKRVLSGVRFSSLQRSRTNNAALQTVLYYQRILTWLVARYRFSLKLLRRKSALRSCAAQLIVMLDEHVPFSNWSTTATMVVFINSSSHTEEELYPCYSRNYSTRIDGSIRSENHHDSRIAAGNVLFSRPRSCWELFAVRQSIAPNTGFSTFICPTVWRENILRTQQKRDGS